MKHQPVKQGQTTTPANLACSRHAGDYWPSVFLYEIAALGSYCHDLWPVFPGTSLVLGKKEVVTQQIRAMPIYVQKVIVIRHPSITDILNNYS